MEVRTSIKAVARATAVNGMFQASLQPLGTLTMDEIVERWATCAQIGRGQARMQIMSFEEFILEQLAKGYQLEFGLVSFYPRLSGGLSSRDADPEADGLFVRGAVKSRRALVNGLKGKLVAENALKVPRVRIYNVFNKERSSYDVVSTGETLSISGSNIPIDLSRDDEGVWLENRTHTTRRKRPWTKVVRGRVVKSDMTVAEVVFDDPIPQGKYFLTVYTRHGHGKDFKAVHCRHEVHTPGSTLTPRRRRKKS